ncbi:tetratricopeptide repeat protein [Arenimonas caeni]|nr:tetratricopeptide repeat protein [Arenimonas caeni]
MKIAHLLKVTALVVLTASLSIPDADARTPRRDRNKTEEVVRYPNATRESPKAENSPRLARDLQKMFDLYNGGEDLEGSISLAEKIIGNERAKPYDRAASLMIAGNAALGIDDYPRAIDYLERALESDALPNNNHFATMHTLASLYAQEDRAEEAVAMVNRLATETRSEDPELYGLKGAVHYNAGQYDQAVAAIRKAIELKTEGEPDSNWIQMLMASYNELGQNNEAVLLAEQLHAKSPDDKRILLNLASLYAETDQGAKAATLLEGARARGMLTEKRDYENLYAIYLNLDGKEAEAAKVIQEGLDKGILPADARTYTFLGQSLYFSDQIDAAIAAYQKGAPLDTTGETYLVLAQVLTNEDRNAEAIAAAKQAIAKGLRRPGDAWMVVARSEYYSDNIAGAQAAYREAAKDPATAEAARKALAQISR